jgi:putative NADPH-quinone reductase
MPALLKGFLEQVLRPGFAFAVGLDKGFPKKLLLGKSARIVVTMDMPAWLYRGCFCSHSIKSLQRNILKFCGISPVRVPMIGSVEAIGSEGRGGRLAQMQRLGQRAH